MLPLLLDRLRHAGRWTRPSPRMDAPPRQLAAWSHVWKPEIDHQRAVGHHLGLPGGAVFSAPRHASAEPVKHRSTEQARMGAKSGDGATIGATMTWCTPKRSFGPTAYDQPPSPHASGGLFDKLTDEGARRHPPGDPDGQPSSA